MLDLPTGYRVPQVIADFAARALAPGIEPTRSFRPGGTLEIRQVDDLAAAVRDIESGAVIAPDHLAAELNAIPVSQIKGLEYDRVVVVEPADIVAAEPRGMNRLYVALTRAVAELVILHTQAAAGEPQGLGAHRRRATSTASWMVNGSPSWPVSGRGRDSATSTSQRAGSRPAASCSAVNIMSGKCVRWIGVRRSDGWCPTMSSVPPGATASASRAYSSVRSGSGRCMKCDDTRSYAPAGTGVVAQVDLVPRDPLARSRGPAVGGVRGGPLQRGPGDVDCRDLPAAAGQPDRVGPFAAPTSRARPGSRSDASATSWLFGLPLQMVGLDWYRSSQAAASNRVARAWRYSSTAEPGQPRPGRR